MARGLYLFNKNWDKDGGVFLDFQTMSKENWFSLIMATTDYKYISLDNYRVADGVISVAGLSEITAGKAAFALEVDTHKTNGNFDYWRCYHINNCRLVSGYAMFGITLDLWGSYFGQASITNLRVLRSNMNVGNGTFDKISYTHTTTTLTDEYRKPVDGMELYELDEDGNAYILDENAYLVFTANCVVSDTSVIDETSVVSAYYIFGNTLKAIRESYPSAVASAHSCVELASRMISGVCGLPTGSSNWEMKKCEISKVYILPASWVETETDGMNFAYKTPFNQTLANIPFYFVKPYWNKIPVNIPALSLDPNYTWLLGTIDDGLELARSTQNDVAYYDVTLSFDGLSVLVKQGEQSQDISKRFEVSLVGKSQEADASTKVVGVLSQMLNAVGGAFKAAGSKDPLGSTMNLVTSSIAGTLEKAVAKSSPSGSVSSADGYITYDYAASDKIGYPFYWTFFKSAYDEQQRARLTGASFNAVFSDWATALAYKSTIFYGENKNLFPFIQADCMVTGVNDEAAMYIETKLRSGVYVLATDRDSIKAMI